MIPVKAFNILYFKPFACSYAIFFRTSGHYGNILWSETNTCQGICPPYSGCRLLASIRRNQILWNWSRRGKYDARLQCETRIHCYNHHIIDIRFDFSRRTFGISEETSHVLELSPRGSTPAWAAASTCGLSTSKKWREHYKLISITVYLSTEHRPTRDLQNITRAYLSVQFRNKSSQHPKSGGLVSLYYAVK